VSKGSMNFPGNIPEIDLLQCLPFPEFHLLIKQISGSNS